jgi:hypothetical protein
LFLQGLIRTYVSFYAYYLGASYIYSIIYIVMLLTSHTDIINVCHEISKDLDSCEQSAKVTKTSAIVSIVLSLLLQTCKRLVVVSLLLAHIRIQMPLSSSTNMVSV